MLIFTDDIHLWQVHHGPPQVILAQSKSHRSLYAYYWEYTHS